MAGPRKTKSCDASADCQMQPVKGGVLTAKGFRAAGVRCGIKQQKSRKDLALLVADQPAAAAGTFTTNKVRAAPVKWCEALLKKRKRVRAVVVNSGNANACTGARGDADAEAMASAVADLVGCEPGEVLVSSTGIIGAYLPMEKIRKGLSRAQTSLAKGPGAGTHFAQAIMTTDKVRKEVAVRVRCKGRTFVLGGCTKGSGMIGPNMATMLAYLTTDAQVDGAFLRRALKQSVERSFNSITVDGHTSTNDTAVLLASGASGVKISDAASRAAFAAALDYVTLELAKAIVRDGEGATKLVQIDVTGARTAADARTAANAMARSPLNLTAIHGGDPNWGRFVSSAGYSGADLDEAKTQLFINGKLTYAFGLPATTPAAQIAGEMRKKDVCIHLDLGLGSGKATVWACDLSHEYITINADYHT